MTLPTGDAVSEWDEAVGKLADEIENPDIYLTDVERGMVAALEHLAQVVAPAFATKEQELDAMEIASAAERLLALRGAE